MIQKEAVFYLGDAQEHVTLHTLDKCFAIASFSSAPWWVGCLNHHRLVDCSILPDIFLWLCINRPPLFWGCVGVPFITGTKLISITAYPFNLWTLKSKYCSLSLCGLSHIWWSSLYWIQLFMAARSRKCDLAAVGHGIKTEHTVTQINKDQLRPCYCCIQSQQHIWSY